MNVKETLKRILPLIKGDKDEKEQTDLQVQDESSELQEQISAGDEMRVIEPDIQDSVLPTNTKPKEDPSSGDIYRSPNYRAYEEDIEMFR